MRQFVYGRSLMTKKKVAAILAALIAILGGILALIDEDPATQPDVPAIVGEIGEGISAVRENETVETVIPAEEDVPETIEEVLEK
jgi:hypothetical protein